VNIDSGYFDHDYYEKGKLSGKSLYENYRWLPELTLPLAQEIIQKIEAISNQGNKKKYNILDFGCAKGFLVQAFRQLGHNAYGVDISNYAIQNSHTNARPFLSLISNTLKIPVDWPKFDWVIAKDVLEHIQPNELFSYLCDLRKISSNILVIVPLGNGSRYYIEDYELDLSHYIREDLDWWINILAAAGFSTTGTYQVGELKSSWVGFHPKGNGLLMSVKS